jgi:hypothetical protein
MEFLNTQDIAEKLGLSFFTVQKYIQAGELPGRKLGGTWVTTDRELRDYMSGKEAYQIDLVQLFDVRGAAEHLHTDVRTVRRLVRAEKLKGTSIDNRGSGTGTIVFSLRQVNAAQKHVTQFERARPGRPLKDNVDEYLYISESGGVTWHNIRDTYDRTHSNYAYKHLHQARARAREAHMSPPVYKKGDKVEIYLSKHPEGKRCHPAFLQHNVTPICRTAVVKIAHPGNDMDGAETIVTVPEDIVVNFAQKEREKDC